MLFCFRFAVFLLAFVASANAQVSGQSLRIARTSTGSGGQGELNSIERLISQLGSDQYFRRRHAEEQLIERGADVFDQLQAAEEHPDLEIATRAHYILQRIEIEWIRPSDSVAVRAAMGNYGELSWAGTTGADRSVG